VNLVGYSVKVLASRKKNAAAQSTSQGIRKGNDGYKKKIFDTFSHLIKAYRWSSEKVCELVEAYRFVLCEPGYRILVN
jgi:hypothetical protein